MSRARHKRRRRTSWRGAVALTLVAIAAGAVSERAETWWPVAAPFIRHGAQTERVDADPVWVTVHGARAAASVIDTYGERFETDGAWISVDITFEARDEPSRVSEVAVRDASGREFRQTDRIDNAMVGGSFDPGVPERGDVVFEVPTDALGDLVVVISPDSPGRTMPRAIAEVPGRVADTADVVELRAPALVVP